MLFLNIAKNIARPESNVYSKHSPQETAYKGGSEMSESIYWPLFRDGGKSFGINKETKQ